MQDPLAHSISINALVGEDRPFPTRVVRNKVIGWGSRKLYEFVAQDGLTVEKATSFTHGGVNSTAYIPRARYGKGAPVKRSHETTKQPKLAASIRKGKQRVPRIRGSKRMVTRAAFLSMLSAHHRGDPSPIRMQARDDRGTIIRILEPMKMLHVLLSAYARFADGDEMRVRSIGYTDRMMCIARKRMDMSDVSGDERKDWQALQAMLRSAEICPLYMLKGSQRTTAKRDWMHSPEWYISDDYIHGRRLSHMDWHSYYLNPERMPSIESSPYAGHLVETLGPLVRYCMHGTD